MIRKANVYVIFRRSHFQRLTYLFLLVWLDFCEQISAKHFHKARPSQRIFSATNAHISIKIFSEYRKKTPCCYPFEITCRFTQETNKNPPCFSKQNSSLPSRPFRLEAKWRLLTSCSAVLGYKASGL